MMSPATHEQIEYYPGELWRPKAGWTDGVTGVVGTLSGGSDIAVVSYRSTLWREHRVTAQDVWLRGLVLAVHPRIGPVTLVLPVDTLTPDVVAVALYLLRVHQAFDAEAA